MSTQLSYILKALLRDTPHAFFLGLLQNLKAADLRIWLFVHVYQCGLEMKKILGYEGGDVPVSGLRAPLVPIVSDKNTEYKYKMLKRKIQIK